MAKDVGCTQSAVSKIWSKNKQVGKVIKEDNRDMLQKISEQWDGKLCLGNKDAQQNKWKTKSVFVTEV